MNHDADLSHHPPLYHITHADNLPSIVAHDCLWSDAQRIAHQIGNVNFGRQFAADAACAQQKATWLRRYADDTPAT